MHGAIRQEIIFANHCTWAHCLAEVTRLLDLPRERLLDPRELQALDGEATPHGVIIPGSPENDDYP